MGIVNNIATAIVTVGVMSAWSLSGVAAKELKLAHFSSPKHHLQTNVLEPLAEKLVSESGGALTLGIYPAGKLGAGPVEQFNRVVDGIADIAYGLPGYTSTLFPKTLLIELPGIPLSEEAATASLWNAKELFEDEYRRVKMLGLWTSASDLLMTRDKPVRSPKDMQGMKIRVPSANVGKAIAAWGATPVSMPAPAIYNALQTGVIDGVFIDGSSLKSFKLHEVINHITVGMPTTLSAFFLLMNRESWDALSAEEQAVVEKLTGRDLSLWANESYRSQSLKELDAYRGMSGKAVIDLTPEEAAAFEALSAPVVKATIAELEDQGVPAGKVVEALRH